MTPALLLAVLHYLSPLLFCRLSRTCAIWPTQNVLSSPFVRAVGSNPLGIFAALNPA